MFGMTKSWICSMQYSIWSSRFLYVFHLKIFHPSGSPCHGCLRHILAVAGADVARCGESEWWLAGYVQKIATFGEPGISNLGKGWKMREVEKRFLEGGHGSIQWYNDPKKRSNRRQCDDYQQQRSKFIMMMIIIIIMMMITNIINIIPIFGAMCPKSRKYFQHAYLAIKFQPGFKVHDHVSQARLVDDALLMVQMRLTGMYKGV